MLYKCFYAYNQTPSREGVPSSQCEVRREEQADGGTPVGIISYSSSPKTIDKLMYNLTFYELMKFNMNVKM